VTWYPMSLVGSLRGVQANPEPCNSNSSGSVQLSAVVVVVPGLLLKSPPACCFCSATAIAAVVAGAAALRLGCWCQHDAGVLTGWQHSGQGLCKLLYNPHRYALLPVPVPTACLAEHMLQGGG
jgi:hypothetical protein